MRKFILFIAFTFVGWSLSLNFSLAADAKPLRALLITGGCCHDYAKQKDVLKRGLEARANIVVDQIHTEIPTGTPATKPPLPICGNPDYAKGYDVIIHDECASDINDPAILKGILAPHRAGIPGVNLHCAVHSFRIGDAKQPAEAGSERALWFDYLGVQSSGHGPQLPIAIHFTNKTHAITRNLADWTTVNEELYNNVQIFSKTKTLARGHQTEKSKDGATTKESDYVVVWLNDYHGTRVFSTSLGHNTATVEDSRYLDLVTRGVLWACGRLNEKGKIQRGYGPKK